MGAHEIVVTFHSYSNPTGRCAECNGATPGVPACCDAPSPVPLDQNCPADESCDTRLTGCFRDVGSTGTCQWIDFTGRILSGSSFTFEDSFFGFFNPVLLPRNRPWQVSSCIQHAHALLLAYCTMYIGRADFSYSERMHWIIMQ